MLGDIRNLAGTVDRLKNAWPALLNEHNGSLSYKADADPIAGMHETLPKAPAPLAHGAGRQGASYLLRFLRCA